MAERVIQCDCGFEARAASDETLAAQVARHAREAHGMALSHVEALQLAARAREEVETKSSDPRVTPKHGRGEQMRKGSPDPRIEEEEAT